MLQIIVIAYISVVIVEVLLFFKRRFQIADIVRNCQENKLFFMNDIYDDLVKNHKFNYKSKKFY